MRFLLVDRIISLAPGKTIVASRKIASDEEYFRDHFPGFPVVPGVLLTEMMGQSAAKCLDAEKRPRGRPILARILSASFRQWVKPGDEVQLHAEITTSDDRYATAECHATVRDQNVAQAKLFFSFVPADLFGANTRDEVLERFLAERSP